jgi:transposase
MDFYSNWSNYRLKEEYLVLGVTSTSSYSELIDDVEFGYNRDNEKLEQINVCMLMGEISMLPIFVMNYQGSLNDVKTLTITINILSSSTKCKEFSLVMDKGFLVKEILIFY